MAKDGGKRVLFAGGGTAGHLMPAINIALELTRSRKEVETLFVGRSGGMEANIVARFGFRTREIEVVGFKRSPAGLLRFISKWKRGMKQAADVVTEFDPGLVVGTGGYVSAPVVRAAHKAGKPVFLQEQNSLPGLATRSLGGIADTIFIAYESASKYLPAAKCRLVGNPVRPDLLSANREESLAEFGLRGDRKTVLVIGGSSGARGINMAILDIVKSNGIPDGWQLLWQIGQKEFVEIDSAISKEKFCGKCMAFIENMPGAYSVADLVISRAGAMALAEIALWGLPAVLIPYPHATGDHQSLNARQFDDKGAAVVIPESEISSRLPVVLNGLFENENMRGRMAEACRGLARPEAASIIAKTILERINAL
jgi:UDP-N-acetylglucosamine--N-acetylmuramyl-(pentapeptide) pyrophosphoryl-undecaprenol N-acetylglucosamine transferase